MRRAAFGPVSYTHLDVYKRQVADIQTADMLNLPVPKANYETVVCKPSEMQKEMVSSLAERADAVRSGAVDPSVDLSLIHISISILTR